MWTLRASWAFRYGAAVAAVALMLGIRLLLSEVLGGHVPFVTLFPAVAFAVWYGGCGPAVLALVLSLLGAAYFILPPFASFAIENPEDWWQLALFFLGSTVIILLVERMRRLRQLTLEHFALAQKDRELLCVTLASIADGVIATDPAGRVRFVNPVAATLLGIEPQEAAGQLLTSVMHIVNARTCESVMNPALSAVTTGRPVALAKHTVLIAKNGTRRTLEDSAAPIRDASGAILGAVLVFRDATSHLLAEAARQASAERLSLALEAGQMGVWEWNLQTDQIYWSESLESIYGLSAGSFPGTREAFWQRIHPDELENVREALLVAAMSCSDYNVEYRTVWPDGSVHWLASRGRGVSDEEGRPLRLLGITTDITERRHADAALQEADRRKDQFLATLAHELRNPLAPLRNALQIVEMAGERGEAAAHNAIAIMKRQVAQIARLIDDLLDVSRLTRDKLELRKEPVALSAVIHSAIESARPLIDRIGHRLTITLPPEPIYLDADTTRLAQVFANLLNNAAKYTRPKGDIWLSAERQGGEVVVSVRDTGIGIAEEQRARLFEMFTQRPLPFLGQPSDGLGIGLSLAQRLVQLHGGQIEARSEGLGKGSVFVVRLPVLAEPQETAAPQDACRATAREDSLRILVVDDNRDAADSLAVMLELAGHTVRTTYDGLTAVEATASFKPQVILLDIGMPQLNGYEVARRIRQQHEVTPIVLIAVTGWGQEKDKQLASEAGFDYHLTKPLDPTALDPLMAALVQRQPHAASIAAPPVH